MENRIKTIQEENWVKWNPTDLPESIYFVTSYIQNRNGTKFTVEDEKHVIEIFFDGEISIIRAGDEGIRMRTWGEVQKKYNNKSFFRNWFLYKVENSGLSKWAEKESCGFYVADDFTHYCIVTSEDIIDVLSTFEPTIDVTQDGLE